MSVPGLKGVEKDRVVGEEEKNCTYFVLHEKSRCVCVCVCVAYL